MKKFFCLVALLPAALSVLLSVGACRHEGRIEGLIHWAEALMADRPDSAFLLLDSLHLRERLTEKQTAAYALQLARATDKTLQSLFPYDSLLNIALNYYTEPTKERAIALLYKGRLERQVKYYENAINHLQEGLLILDNFPQERETRRITLGQLGDLYYNQKHYEDCIRVYRELLPLCDADIDKAYTYSDIGSYFAMKHEKDSAFYYKKLALQYAIQLKDSSLIADYYHSLGLTYHVFYENKDSALYYARKGLSFLPNDKPSGRFHNTIGFLIYYSGGDRDSALTHVKISALDTTYSNRFSVNQYVGYIEEERGNDSIAAQYYLKYIATRDSLDKVLRSVDVQRLIYDYNTKLAVQREQHRAGRERSRIRLVLGLLCLSIVVAAACVFHRRRQHDLLLRQQAAELEGELHSLQQELAECEEEIRELELLAERERETNELRRRIAEREEQADRLKAELERMVAENAETVERLKAELERETAEGLKLMELIRQGEERRLVAEQAGLQVCAAHIRQCAFYGEAERRGRAASVRSDVDIFSRRERAALKQEVFRVYQDYVAEQRRRHPRLKEEDLLFLCLDSSGMNGKAMAVCLGYPQTNAVYKLRRRVREKCRQPKTAAPMSSKA